MTELAVTGSPAATSPPAATSGGGGGTGALSSDFETFLKMLTAQMENQDPMNPVDSADYAVQLATFSGVEQQVLTNDLLSSLLDRLGGSLGELAGWVGSEARVAAPVAYDGAPITVEARSDPEATAARLVVRDAQGAVVDSQPLPPGGGTLDWAPASAEAAPATGTLLSFEVLSYAGEAPLGTAVAEVYAPVREVRRGDSGLEVVLPGGVPVPAEEVTALREA